MRITFALSISLAMLTIGILGGITFYQQVTRPRTETEQPPVHPPEIIDIDAIKETNGLRHLIPLEKLIPGGPPKDGIPSIDNPKFVSAIEADGFLTDDELVLGLVFQGVARAYPRMILVWHEIVNDNINGVPILITYCPLCYTGTAFIRIIDGQEVEFGVSGKLYNSDLVMYDRMTDSYWSQILGLAIVGPMTGKSLERIPIDTLRWGDWKSLHPDTEVLSIDTGHWRPYGSDPYGNYYTSGLIMFPVDNTDARLPSKALVYGVVFSNRAKAYAADAIARVGLLNDDVGGRSLLIVFDPVAKVVRIFGRSIEGVVLEFDLVEGRIFDKQSRSEWSFQGEAIDGRYRGSKLRTIIAPAHFWFAWAAFYPGTDIFS